MGARYEPRDHIQPIEVTPQVEGVLDQREITVQSYQTTIRFDFKSLDASIEQAWLTPVVRLGVFQRTPLEGRDEIHVVLGLQGVLSVKAYDYDQRRPLFYSWRDVVVETVAVRYFRDDQGFVRFSTFGGGPRITEEKLHEFNAAFLKIPKDAVVRLRFDLDRLRSLCFGRFLDRLYMLRFSNPSGQEYRSIDHALFQSRRYIDPAAERLREVQGDPQVKVESFDSDILVLTSDLVAAAEVRFFIRGLSGALRLRFPKVPYGAQLKTVEEQVRVFYRLVDETVRSILDADYYARRRLTLAEIEKYPEFPEIADTGPYREVLRVAEAREEYFSKLDVGAPKLSWLPHLRAIDELLAIDALQPEDVAVHISTLVERDPGQALRLLSACAADPMLSRVGALAAGALHAALQALPADVRAHAEELLLAWNIDHETDGWDVDVESGEIRARNLRWKTEDLSLDVLPAVLWKLMGVLHARLQAGSADVASDLAKYSWCTTMAKELPANQPSSHTAIRLLAAGRVPRTPQDGRRVLKELVTTFSALDDAVLDQFGLPLWPCLCAERKDGAIVLANAGIGAALAVAVAPCGDARDGVGGARPVDLVAGEAVSVGAVETNTLTVTFEKYGAKHEATVPIADSGSGAAFASASVLKLRPALGRKRVEAQRRYRDQIDKGHSVVGASPGLLQLFEEIQHVNEVEGGAAVLLLGEPGVGKTHVAKLLHDSSSRAVKPYKEVNAAGGGGDLNIQRGEWIGYGKGHGISGVDPKGKMGHLMGVHGGTLFIDEFVAFSQDLQVIFLSVLEKRGVQQVGGETVRPDVRCIFATNADVDEAVENGRLRRDLLDRIALRIAIPPLRDRRGDVIELARHFAGDDSSFDDRCLVALLRYDWPGNVREVQNKVKAAVSRKNGDGATTIKVEHMDLPEQVVAGVRPLGADDARRELWTLADRIGREEGFEPGAGLQKRAGEILGVQESQASKMYDAFGLSRSA